MPSMPRRRKPGKSNANGRQNPDVRRSLPVRDGNAEDLERSEGGTDGQGEEAGRATIESIRKDAASGVSNSEIARKYGISGSTAFYHIGKSGRKHAGAGAKLSAPRKGNGKHTAGDHFSVQLTPAAMDAVWSSLAPEKKAELPRGL